MRFPFFTECWEKVYLKKILKIFYGKDYKDQNIGKIPVYGTGGIICYIGNYLCNWSCVCIGRKGTINKPIYIDKPFWCVDTLFYSKATNGNSSKFQYYLFQTINWNKFNEASGVPSLSSNTIESIKKYIPNLVEQQKIADFLSLIDKRIDTQSKIIEDLELFKNLISDKVLYNDKTACFQPLSLFSELKNGYAFKSNTYSNNGNLQIVTIANVTGDRYIDLTSSNKVLNIPNDIQTHQILKTNNILISLTGNVGRVSYCNKSNCLLNQRVGLLNLKNKESSEYIFQCIHNKKFEKNMILKGQGVAQLNIGKNDVESFEIPIFSEDKMRNISEMLKEIDFKLIKEKDILELYKKQKAYLLKNMFI